MKKVWDWEDKTCLESFWVLFKEGVGVRKIAEKLSVLYEDGPHESAVNRRLHREDLTQALEELFDPKEVGDALRAFLERAPVPTTGMKGLWQPKAAQNSSEPDPDDVRMAEQLEQYFDNELASQTRIGSCRGLNDTCGNKPEGGPYCARCGEILYQSAEEHKKADERMRNLARWA